MFQPKDVPQILDDFCTNAESFLLLFNRLMDLPTSDTYLAYILFERGEFLIATCKKKKTDRLCGCLYVRIILVLVCHPVQQYKHHV